VFSFQSLMDTSQMSHLSFTNSPKTKTLSFFPQCLMIFGVPFEQISFPPPMTALLFDLFKKHFFAFLF
jgi:hypothetical protein